MERCPNSWFGAHRFEGRYEQVETKFQAGKVMYWPDDLPQLLFRNAYVRDVCVKCGATIERQK